MLFTIVSVAGTLLLGSFIAKKMNVDNKTGYLISSGTAICGGSAIAAVGPVIKANDGQMSVALGTVFILNAIALFLFPVLGHLFELTQHQFGLWSPLPSTTPAPWLVQLPPMAKKPCKWPPR